MQLRARPPGTSNDHSSSCSGLHSNIRFRHRRQTHAAPALARCRPGRHDRLHDHGEQQWRPRFVALHEPRHVERPHAHRPRLPHLVFVVGISVVFATAARLARGASRAQLARHTIQRAVILILFGMVVNGFPYFHLAHFRFYGVLQRIGICYLVVGLFYLWDQRVSTKIAALVASLVGYWVLVRWVPIPGVGTPGRDVPFMDMSQNLVSWIDRHLFPYHLYLYSPDHNVRDPEGLLSDLPAVGTALMGILTGLWLRTRRTVPAKTLGLAAASVTSLAIGYLWSLWFPLN